MFNARKDTIYALAIEESGNPRGPGYSYNVTGDGKIIDSAAAALLA